MSPSWSSKLLHWERLALSSGLSADTSCHSGRLPESSHCLTVSPNPLAPVTTVKQIWSLTSWAWGPLVGLQGVAEFFSFEALVRLVKFAGSPRSSPLGGAVVVAIAAVNSPGWSLHRHVQILLIHAYEQWYTITVEHCSPIFHWSISRTHPASSNQHNIIKVTHIGWSAQWWFLHLNNMDWRNAYNNVTTMFLTASPSRWNLQQHD